MSNLILPPNLQMPFLEKNLAALFRRYPHERQRLEPTLSIPAKKFALKQIELPTPPARPPIRVLLLCGIGNPMFLADYFNHPVVQKENFKTFIIENDPEFLAFCFQQTDLTQIINYPKSEWILLHSPESIKSAFFRALKPEAVTSMMMNVQVFTVECETTHAHQDFYDIVPKIYDETRLHVMHNNGNTADSLLGVEVTLRNKQYLRDNPGIDDLKDYFKGATALIVGAGPSLDQNLEAIKQVNDKVLVIAVDAALKPLMAAGIRVDYVTSIERLNSYQKPFFENLENVEADLVAFPVVHPEVLDAYPGDVRIVYRNYSFYAYFEKAFPKGILRCGGSTSHLGVRLADYLGCRRALFVGLDSCYEEKDGLYRSHCSGTGHPDWGNFMPLQDFNTVRKHAPAIQAYNNLGQPAATNLTYYQWCKEYSEELAYLGQRMSFINCSATGLRIDGIPYKPLLEIASNLDPLAVSKPKASQFPKRARAWDNSEILKNFEGWQRVCVEGIKEADALTQMEKIDSARFHALHYAYNFRILIDDLFVAFVVQCCAREFFELENKWWSYSLDFETELKEKAQVLKERLVLFEDTLGKLIEMFRRDG